MALGGQGGTGHGEGGIFSAGYLALRAKLKFGDTEHKAWHIGESVGQTARERWCSAEA